MEANKIKFKNTVDLQKQINRIQPLIFERLETDNNIYKLDLLVIGLLNRTYELTDTAIWALHNNRPQTSANMLRGLIETLAFTYYWATKIDPRKEEYSRLSDEALFGSKKKDGHYKSVHIMDCLRKSSEMFPQIMQSYDDACEIVHPNAASHFYCIKPVGRSKKAQFHIPFYEFKNKDKSSSTNQIGECVYHIINLCEIYFNSICKSQ